MFQPQLLRYILNCQSKSKADWDIKVPLAEVGDGGNILDEWLLSGPLSGQHNGALNMLIWVTKEPGNNVLFKSVI